VAFGLSAIAGPDARAPLSLDDPGSLFARPLDRRFTGARVAWFKDLGGLPFDPRVRAIVDAHRQTFTSLGCLVEEAEPDFGPAEAAFRVLRAWNSAHAYGDRYRAEPASFKDTLRAEIEAGLRLSGNDVAEASAAHAAMWRRFQAFLERYEYFVLPTTQLPPFDVGLPYPGELAGVRFESYIDWMKSCWYISATGNPAASVPGGFTSGGLPVGLQIVGRHRADFSVLQLAHAFEQATGVGLVRPALA
jgi:amidase